MFINTKYYNVHFRTNDRVQNSILYSTFKHGGPRHSKLFYPYGKQYISKQKMSKKEIYFFEFLNHTRIKLEIIITSNLIWERENSEWQNNLYDVL